MVKRETRKYSLLRLIFDLGGETTREKINEHLPKYWELSQNEKEIEKGVGKPLFWHRSASVCQSLKDRDGYLENPSRGIWKITDKGKEYLSSRGISVTSSPIDQEKPIEIVAMILSTLINFEKSGITLFSNNTIRIALVGQGYNYESDEVENALKFLSTAPFNILQKQNYEYSLTGDY